MVLNLEIYILVISGILLWRTIPHIALYNYDVTYTLHKSVNGYLVPVHHRKELLEYS